MKKYLVMSFLVLSAACGNQSSDSSAKGEILGTEATVRLSEIAWGKTQTIGLQGISDNQAASLIIQLKDGRYEVTLIKYDFQPTELDVGYMMKGVTAADGNSAVLKHDARLVDGALVALTIKKDDKGTYEVSRFVQYRGEGETKVILTGASLALENTVE